MPTQPTPGAAPTRSGTWTRRRGAVVGIAWIVLWLLLLVPPMRLAAEQGGVRGWTTVAAYVLAAIAYFLACMVVFQSFRTTGSFHRPTYAVLLGVAIGATVLALALHGAPALQLLPYVAVVIAIGLPWPVAAAVIVPLSVALYGLHWLVPSWPVSHGLAFGTLGSGVGAALGRFSAQRSRVAEAMTAHAQQLEIAEERNGMARDLHDILGHSLTVIALKSELAEKLVDTDPARARSELGEVRQLARAALGDVRSTVNNYRELSLAGEIARAASTLRAAGLRADLPTVVDEVPDDLRELFAWALREGVTNVVRHAEAQSCVVTLTRSRSASPTTDVVRPGTPATATVWPGCGSVPTLSASG